MNPKVYIETSIPSYLAARQSNDLRAMANQNATIEWWEKRKPEFDIYISEFVIAESSQGDPDAAIRPQVEAVCRSLGFEPPVICTPQELMEG